MTHKFFADIDVEKLLKKQVPAPFIPKIEDEDFKKLTQVHVVESMVPEEAQKKISDMKDAFDKFGLADQDENFKKI